MTTTFGLVIVGSETLCGRRTDMHLPYIGGQLERRGLRLGWARFVGDDEAAQAALYRETLAGKDAVISCGGIGATPDDRTRQAAALAAGVQLVQHPEATAMMTTCLDDEPYSHRMKMAQLPAGCSLIPNPVSRIPGFSIERHHFLPGFHDMVRPMLDWVLDHHYAQAGEHQSTCGFIVPGAREGDLIDLMETVVERWPDTHFSCLPSFGNAHLAERHIEFSLTGKPARANEAAGWLKAQLQERRYNVLS